MPNRARPPRSLLLGALSLLDLVTGCGDPAAPALSLISSLPPGELILVGAEPLGAPRGYGLYLVDPTSGTMTACVGHACYTPRGRRERGGSLASASAMISARYLNNMLWGICGDGRWITKDFQGLMTLLAAWGEEPR